MTAEELRALVINALEDLKAENIVELDVRDKTDVTDYIIVASGNSSRHVKAIANNVVMDAKQAGHPPLGVEGETDGEWMLVDLADVVADSPLRFLPCHRSANGNIILACESL